MRTKKGLFLVVILIYLILSSLLKPFIQDGRYIIAISCILGLLYTLYWRYFSGRLFFSNRIKILFAIDYTEETKKHYESIIKIISSKIDELNLSRSIIARSMPSDFSMKSRERAEGYARKRMTDLIIWGYTLEGFDNKEKTSEFKLKFTYLYRLLPEFARPVLIKHIDDSIKGRYWKILDNAFFNDIQVVSTNITEISLFIIALSLSTRGRLNECLAILEKLNLLISNKKPEDFPNLSIFKEHIQTYLIEIYRFLGEKLRYDKPKESKIYYENILRIKPDDSKAHLDIARLCYVVDNDLSAAKHHTDKVTDDEIRPLANYNYAFFAIKNKNPKDLLKYYQKIKTNPSGNIVQIIDFLQAEYAKEQSNILYLFALGYINVYHCDCSIEVGISDLKEFIEKGQNIPEYDELVSNAKALLANREKKLKSKIVIEKQ
ncbi:MAG: hypothetical protein V2A72_03795 [Candidatus Omnitrophota bacterium]